eukprot:4189805-Amphidinium_carterae.1
MAQDMHLWALQWAILEPFSLAAPTHAIFLLGMSIRCAETQILLSSLRANLMMAASKVMFFLFPPLNSSIRILTISAKKHNFPTGTI